LVFICVFLFFWKLVPLLFLSLFTTSWFISHYIGSLFTFLSSWFSNSLQRFPCLRLFSLLRKVINIFNTMYFLVFLLSCGPDYSLLLIPLSSVPTHCPRPSPTHLLLNGFFFSRYLW
jgi:hypothetical protein